VTRTSRGGRGTTLRLAFGGLWFRRSTALIVLVLATVASAASVVAPLYSRAAEASILRDTLRRADAFTLSVQVAVPQAGSGAGEREARDGSFMVETAETVLSHPAFGRPRLSYAGNGTYSPTAGPLKNGVVVGQVVERAGICQHLPLAAGRCPTAAGEGLVTRRSLALIGAQIGQTVDVELEESATVEGGGLPPVLKVKVVGTFDPVPVESAYWAGRPYFSTYYPEATTRELESVPPTADPVFVGLGTAKLGQITTYTVDVPVRPLKVQLEDAATLRKQIRRLSNTTAGYLVTTYSQLPAALARADDGRELVRIAAPLAVTQLVLLSWWTLYLVVGSATEERSPEIGLAKLRGMAGPQTRRFGLAEVFLLLLLAAPLGTLVGYLAVRGSARRVFAPGTEVVFTWPVLLTVLAAVAGGLVTAALSSRQVFRRPVSELLRRVPPRRAGKRAGLVDGVVLVLAVAGVVQLVSDRGGRPSPVALLGPGMVAVAGGLLAARLLVRVARRRTAVSLARGRAAGTVGWAGVARRPGTSRIASVLAVATCLLLVGVQAWTVAERNRVERSEAETGAQVVLQVRAAGPRAVLDAVRAADPDGGYAMAAVQVTTSNQEPQMVAVDATRADRVIGWGSPASRPSRSVARGDRRPHRGGQPLAVAPHRPAGRARHLRAGAAGRAAAWLAHLRRRPAGRLHRCRLPAGGAGSRPPGHRHRQRHGQPADRGRRAGSRRRRPGRAARRQLSGAQRVAPRAADHRWARGAAAARRRAAGPAAVARRPVRRDRSRRLARAVARAGRPRRRTRAGRQGWFPVRHDHRHVRRRDPLPRGRRRRLRAAGRRRRRARRPRAGAAAGRRRRPG
jgi:putative ABC transport system permease protein